MRYRSCVSGLAMICSGTSRCRRPKGPWTDLTARVVAADECFTGIESHIVGTRRRLSQTRALRVLKEVAEALNSASTEQQAAGEALRRMASLLGVATGWVWLRDPASSRFYNAAVQSLPPYLQEPVRMTGRSCWCLELFQSGQLTARNIDVVGCSRLPPALKSRQAALAHGPRCHASVPVDAGEPPLGVSNPGMCGWGRPARPKLRYVTD